MVGKVCRLCWGCSFFFPLTGMLMLFVVGSSGVWELLIGGPRWCHVTFQVENYLMENPFPNKCPIAQESSRNHPTTSVGGGLQG